jgi:hypothetical protein
MKNVVHVLVKQAHANPLLSREGKLQPAPREDPASVFPRRNAMRAGALVVCTYLVGFDLDASECQLKREVGDHLVQQPPRGSGHLTIEV